MTSRLTLAALAFCAANASGEDRVFTIEAGANARVSAPAWLPAPPDGLKSNSALKAADGAVYPLQPDMRTAKSQYAWIAPALEAGRKLELRLTSAETHAGIDCAETPDGVVVTIDGKPFTTYLTHAASKPTLWPLLGPKGEQLTADGPKDHVHHRSFWFTHGKVNGVDFWSVSKKAGKTVHRRFRSIVSGPVFGEIEAENDWIALDGTKVCSDVRTIRFYRTKDARLVDFGIRLFADRGELVFGDDKEGTFGVRVAPSIAVDQGKGKPKGGTLVNAEGLKDAAVWGKKSPWCDYYGPIDGHVAGVAIFDHPTNLRHPTTWHARTYGLFTANPFGLSFFTNRKQEGTHRVPSGGELRLQYRVVLHEGDEKAARIAEQFAAYASPPSFTSSTAAKP